jgi:outer membrane beta-barrel protein
VALAAAAPAWGQSPEGERVFAIQNRRHLMAHEFAGAVGVLPMDAFFKGLTFSGSYTYHFTDLLGWEMVHGIYSREVATDLEEDLETNFGVRPTDHEGWDYAIGSSIVFKPLYGKIAAANRTVVHHEVFLVAGPSAAHLPEGFAYGPSLGLGLRFFASRLLSIRFDVRDMVHFGGGDIRNDVWLALGVAFNVGGGERP